MAATKKGLRRWFWDQRTSSRMAFLLNLVNRLSSGFISLAWTRLLRHAMTEAVYDIYLEFIAIFSLGGLGDLGMGGAVGIRTGQFLGEGKEKELKQFLSSARMVFLMMAASAAVVMLLMSPWLPHWLIGHHATAAGSLPMAFVIGGPLLIGVILKSYASNVNYACGNVMWPIVPSFVLLQLNLLGTWLLAREHFPLWVQFCPAVTISVIDISLLRYYVRLSHPSLANFLPLRLDRRMTLTLLESTGWLYLCSLGNVIYRTTDTMMINKSTRFPAGTTTQYTLNYKFCDLVVFLVLTASFVILPKITQWMASSDPKDQARVRTEMRRLNQFQTLLGCGAALAYLAFNNLFIKLWYWKDPNPLQPVSLAIQLAFALNLAVTTSGDTSIQLTTRTGRDGLRMVGMAIGLTGLLNLVLSAVAMKADSLWGIAMATVLAQSILSLVTSGYLCRHLQITWWSWALKSWLLPVAGIVFAAWLRSQWPPDSWAHTSGLLAVYVTLFLAAAWGLGVTPAFVRDELSIVFKSFRK